MEKKSFRDQRRVLWLIGGVILLGGILAWGIFAPGTSELPGSGGPDVQLPSMSNVPGQSAPKMDIETQEER